MFQYADGVLPEKWCVRTRLERAHLFCPSLRLEVVHVFWSELNNRQSHPVVGSTPAIAKARYFFPTTDILIIDTAN